MQNQEEFYQGGGRLDRLLVAAFLAGRIYVIPSLRLISVPGSQINSATLQH